MRHSHRLIFTLLFAQRARTATTHRCERIIEKPAQQARVAGAALKCQHHRVCDQRVVFQCVDTLHPCRSAAQFGLYCHHGVGHRLFVWAIARCLHRQWPHPQIHRLGLCWGGGLQPLNLAEHEPIATCLGIHLFAECHLDDQYFDTSAFATPHHRQTLFGVLHAQQRHFRWQFCRHSQLRCGFTTHG